MFLAGLLVGIVVTLAAVFVAFVAFGVYAIATGRIA